MYLKNISNRSTILTSILVTILYGYVGLFTDVSYLTSTIKSLKISAPIITAIGILPNSYLNPFIVTITNYELILPKEPISYKNNVNYNSNAGFEKKSNQIIWLNDYKTAKIIAKKENKPLFIEFTGFTHTNSRWMEQNILKTPEVIGKLSKFVKVRLYTDRNLEPYISNKRLQETKFGSLELPLFVILTPEGRLVDSKTFDRDLNNFLAFMDKGINSVK